MYARMTDVLHTHEPTDPPQPAGTSGNERSAAPAGLHNIARYLPQMAQERPQQAAVISASGRDRQGQARYTRLSYAELNRASDAYAWGLSAYGLRQGMRVLLLVRPGLPLISLTLALLKLGCVIILIDPAMGIENLRRCIAECEPTALIGIERAQLARLIFRRTFRTVQHAITVGRRWGWGGPTLDELSIDLQTPFPLATVQPHDSALILFTTGSTGPPKAVPYTHAMLEAQVALIRDCYAVAAGEVDLVAFPLFALFDIALGVTAAIPAIDPTRPAACNPARIVELINDQRVTISFGSPAIWERVAHYCSVHKLSMPSLRRVLMAGAPVPLKLHQQLRPLLASDGDTHTPYGATEALPITSISGSELLQVTAERNDITAGTCVGGPVPGITLRIIPISDAPIASWDESLALPPYTIGEIVVQGPTVTTMYVNRPAATAAAKIPAGDNVWHRMGDLGYLDAAGRLWFYGRKSHRVQLADRCLYTEPCEQIFNQHPAVRRSALVGVPQAAGAMLPVIVIEPLAGQMPRSRAARAQLIAELRELGAQQPMTAMIATFLFHPAFPVDVRHNAKIFRERLALWATRQLATHR